MSRGRIGVQIDQVTKDVAESIGLGKAQGALVRSVEAGSPGEKAGVEPGDIITKFDGKPIEKPSDLPRLVGNTKPGTKSTLTVFRRGSSRDLTVTIAEIEPDKPAQAAGRSRRTGAQAAGLRGRQVAGVWRVSDLTDAQKKELKLKGGVKDRCRHRRGRARRPARRRRDPGGGAIPRWRTLKEFDAALAKADKSKPVSVLFRRGDWAQYALIRPAR